MNNHTLVKFLCNYIPKQIENMFPDEISMVHSEWEKVVNSSLKRLKISFSQIKAPHYQGDFEDTFNYLHSDHYAMFLYLLSNELYKDLNDEKMASKVFVLNKALHGIDAFYGIELPEVFLFVHPVGTVLGNAKYGNFFCVYQNCTIGSILVGDKFEYPQIGDNVVLFANSSVIGKCDVGNNVIFGANSSIVSKNIESKSIVLGTYPHNKITSSDKDTNLFKA